MKLRILVAAAVLLAGGVRASAHPAPFSYLDIVFRNGGIDGTLVVHIIDVAHDLGIQPVERLLNDRLVQSESERIRSEEHTSELQSRLHLVCRLLLEQK